jgi:hypothetical protein
LGAGHADYKKSNGSGKSNGGNNVNYALHLLLEGCLNVGSLGSEFGNATNHGVIAGTDYNTIGLAFNAKRTVEEEFSLL